MLTLLDVAKMNGTDEIVGLIEEVVTFAPELMSIGGRVISGTSFKTLIRTGFPPVGFRAANQGSVSGNSTYDQATKECYILDGQIAVDEAVATAPESGGADLLLAREATGIMRQTLIAVGQQVWSGTSANKAGFQGAAAQVDASLYSNAGGVAANSTSVFGLWQNTEGVEFIFGGGKGLGMKPDWRVQTLYDGNGKPYTGFVNNIFGWIGLAVNHTKSIGQLAGCDGTNAAKSVTDANLAALLAKYPVGMAPTNWYMTRAARFQLQASRSFIGNGTNIGDSPKKQKKLRR